MGFFSKFDKIRRKLRIWSHLLAKSFMKNFIFSAVPARKIENVYFENVQLHNSKSFFAEEMLLPTR